MSFSALIPSILLCSQRHLSKTQIWSCHFSSYQPSVPAHRSRDNVLNRLVRPTCIHDLTHQLNLANPWFPWKTSTPTPCPSLFVWHPITMGHAFIAKILYTLLTSLLLHTPRRQRLCQTFGIVAIWYHDWQHFGWIEMLNEWIQLDVQSCLYLFSDSPCYSFTASLS